MMGGMLELKEEIVGEGKSAGGGFGPLMLRFIIAEHWEGF